MLSVSVCWREINILWNFHCLRYTCNPLTSVKFASYFRDTFFSALTVAEATPYEKMTGEFFTTFIREHFNFTFANAGPKADSPRLFVMDNDPSQTSHVAKGALEEIEGSFHEIPPRSPDLNPIENISILLSTT